MRLRTIWILVAMAGVAGCSQGEPDEPLVDFDKIPLVPAGGLVTLDHKPLAHAVVSFMPRHGPIATGETNASGRYTLSYGRKGAPVGDYVVAVSYLVSAEGEPQGLGPRSSLSPPPSMSAAVERLPKEYSDLGRSTLRAKVPPQGSDALNFDLRGPLLPGPESEGGAGAPAKDESPAPQS